VLLHQQDVYGYHARWADALLIGSGFHFRVIVGDLLRTRSKPFNQATSQSELFDAI